MSQWGQKPRVMKYLDMEKIMSAMILSTEIVQREHTCEEWLNFGLDNGLISQGDAQFIMDSYDPRKLQCCIQRCPIPGCNNMMNGLLDKACSQDCDDVLHRSMNAKPPTACPKTAAARGDTVCAHQGCQSAVWNKGVYRGITFKYCSQECEMIATGVAAPVGKRCAATGCLKAYIHESMFCSMPCKAKFEAELMAKGVYVYEMTNATKNADVKKQADEHSGGQTATAVYAICQPKARMDQYNAYVKALAVKNGGGKGANERRRWHGTKVACAASWLGAQKHNGIAGGSPCGNAGCAFCSILTKNFDLSRARASGMFGAGIYFTSFATKSFGYQSGTAKKTLFLCKVAVGKPYMTTTSMNGITAPPAGTDSVLYDKTKNNVPGTVNINDELIIYDGSAAYPSYVVVF